MNYLERILQAQSEQNSWVQVDIDTLNYLQGLATNLRYGASDEWGKVHFNLRTPDDNWCVVLLGADVGAFLVDYVDGQLLNHKFIE